MRQTVILFSFMITVLASISIDLPSLQSHPHHPNKSYGPKDIDYSLRILRPRAPTPGSTRTRSSQANTEFNKSPAKADFQQEHRGVVWLKNQDGKTYHHLGPNGATGSGEDQKKMSAGGFGSKGGVLNTWAVGEKSKVSADLARGSELIVKTTQADGTSSKTKFNKPGKVKQEFESGFSRHPMRIDAELHGEGKARVRGSQE